MWLSMEKATKAAKAVSDRRKTRHAQHIAQENRELYLLMVTPVILIFILNYLPMFGLVIAFQDFKLGSKFFGANVNWVGFKHFIDFINSPLFGRLFGNTLRLSIKNVLFTFWIPIAFALLLNEVRHLRLKKLIQTASYLPHFISTVVVAGMVLSFLRTDGLINKFVEMFGGTRTAFITNAEYFDTIYITTLAWVGFGFSSILYLSAISSVDAELYESARMDGASRWKQVWHITIPSILPTIAIMLIMSIGSMVASNTDMILLLYNEANASKSDVIGTYVYRMGLGADGGGGHYSEGTAISMFTNIINITLLFIANKISKKVTDYGLW